MVNSLDSLDWKLLLELAANCRITYSELGELFELPATTVWRRIKKMIKSGVIASFEIAVGPDYDASKELTFFLKTMNSCSNDELISKIRDYPGTAAVSHIINSRSIVTMEYIEQSQIPEYYEFISQLKGVSSVDMYKSKQFHWWDDRPKVEPKYTGLELEVINCLLENPRKPVEEVADCLKMKLKKIRSILDGLITSRRVWFKVRWNPNTELSHAIIMRLSLSNIHSDHTSIIDWISGNLSDVFLTKYPIESENEIFAWFNIEKISDSLEIRKFLLEHMEIDSVEVLYFPHHVKKPRYGTRLLRKIVEDYLNS